MPYKSAKESALLLVFLHPCMKTEEDRLLLKYQVTEWVVASSAISPTLVQGSRVAFRWRMWHMFALACLADSCSSGFNWNQDLIGIKQEILPLGLCNTEHVLKCAVFSSLVNQLL